MKNLVFLATAALMGISSLAQAGYVHGYTRSNGTYVQGYYRSTPNSTRADNYGPSRGVSSTPYYSRDNDRDGTPNQYDTDDNNNGRHDDTDSCQYCVRP